MNHDYPKSIVLYRHGVCDDQLSSVEKEEVPRLLSTCKDVVLPDGAKCTPKLIIVVVNKGNKARLFLNEVSCLNTK